MLQQRIIEMMAEERMQRAREEAALARAVRVAPVPSIPFRQRLAVSFANLLIAAGTRIERRYQPIRYSEPEGDCSTC